MEPLPGCLIVNLGDMLCRSGGCRRSALCCTTSSPPWNGTQPAYLWRCRWTNSLYRSTLHRVVNTTGQERYSLPLFYEPNFEALVAALDSVSPRVLSSCLCCPSDLVGQEEVCRCSSPPLSTVCMPIKLPACLAAGAVRGGGPGAAVPPHHSWSAPAGAVPCHARWVRQGGCGAGGHSCKRAGRPLSGCG